jgi:outer membrane immunogenic protein
MNASVKMVLAAVGVMCAPSIAAAADLPVKAAPRVVADMGVSWTGFYVGASGAYHDGEITDRGCVGLCQHDHKVRKPYLAFNAGYDYQLPNNVVLGAFGWVAVTRITDEAVLAPGVIVKGRSDFGGFLGGRVGYAFGNALVYGFGGIESVSGKVTIAVAPIPVNERTHVGFGTGVGLEYAIASGWSVDGRYMYSSLERKDYDFGGGVTSAGENAHTFSVGINYRFGGPSAAVARY